MTPDEASMSPDQPTSDPGDLGRRVARRREELGLSREQVAERAAMAPAYLEYLEQHPAEVTTVVLLRLAGALETAPAELLGKGIGLPAGRHGAAPHPVLEHLSAEECRAKLAAGGVGRLVMVEERGPVALPVNFGWLDEEVILRTTESSALISAEAQLVGFETDHIDDASSEGWSVLASGRLRRITDPGDLQRVSELKIEPWAGSDRSIYLGVAVTELSGRRVRAT